jgi:plasmid stabilization system protein ParE
MAEQIDAWWRSNRPAAPDLFLEELSTALALLSEAPGVGAPHPHRTLQGIRRFYLARTRFHVYYAHDESAGEVVVLAVWSAQRALTPPLRPR